MNNDLQREGRTSDTARIPKLDEQPLTAALSQTVLANALRRLHGSTPESYAAHSSSPALPVEEP